MSHPLLKRELRQNMFIPKVERKLSVRRLVLGLVILGLGTAGALEASTVARSRGPELQARCASAKASIVEGWDRIQSTTMGWQHRAQILKDVAVDVWREFRYDVGNRADDARIWWKQAFGKRERELADAEDMSLLLDKPLVLYVAPKEQWKVFWKGVEPYYLKVKLAQIALISFWFLLVGAIAFEDHTVYKMANKYNQWLYGRVGDQNRDVYTGRPQYQVVETDDMFVSAHVNAVG